MAKYFYFDVSLLHVEPRIRRWKDESEGFTKKYAKTREELLQVLERHDATPGEVSAVFDKVQATNLEVVTRVVDRRFALRDSLTREEWKQVFPR